MNSKKVNCIIIHKKSEKTHYAIRNNDGTLNEKTLCGIKISVNYSILTTDVWHGKVNCEKCDCKDRMLRGTKNHWLNME